MTSKLTREALDDETLAELIAFRRSRVEHCQREGLPYQKVLHDSMMLALEELQERRKADSEPVVYASEETLAYAAHGELLVKVLSQPAGDAIIPLYRHAQPIPVVDSEPVAYIFKHPAGRLFWALTDESNKGQSDVMPVYATPRPAPVVSEAYEIIAEAWRLMDGQNPEASEWHTAASRYLNACRTAMLQLRG
ncbi:TPA: hypothetical protein L9A94_002771 [Klebsiella pneumoniae]|nr:hypothetical protein [Klebsiella pneumoniae]